MGQGKTAKYTTRVTDLQKGISIEDVSEVSSNPEESGSTHGEDV